MVYNKGLDIVGDYSEFAERYGLDASDVTMYADGMRKGSSAQAARALAEIGRKIIAAHEDEIHSLLDMRKFRKPVEKALKDAFGDVDKLIDERRKQVEEERNTMEASRKRADEEAAARKHRLDELSMLTSDEINNLYMEAIENGDDAVAREMLDEAARRKGYGDAESDYQGVGAWGAPSKPDYETDEARRNAVGEDSPDLNVEDMAAGYSNQPQDIFVHPEKYSQGLSTSKESGKAIQTAIDDIRSGKKDVKVKVYRAVPTTVKEDKLRNGDWVTPSKEYAEIHGNNRLDGMYRIIEDEVPASELWWDSNDVNEWGYDNGKSYRYKNVKNNRKLDDLVTRDDKGNVIPPSKRFNQRKADERYHRGVEVKNPSKAEVVLRDAVIERLRERGMDVITDVAEGQRVLDAANGKVRQMSFGDAYDYDAYPLGRVEPNLAEKEVAVVEADVNHGFANYKKAKAWAKQHVSKVYNDEESGGKGEVRISNAAIDKFMSQSAIDKSDSKDVHMAVLKVLPEVLKSSIDVETHPDFLKGEDGKRRAENGMNKDVLVHRCYGAVSFDGKPYRVKMTLKEDPRDVSFPHVTHSYEATKIELLAGTWENHEGPSPNTNNSISAAKLLKNVGMSYNSSEKVLDASKKRSDGAALTSRKDGDVHYFRTANGEAYGFTVGGKIYVDPRIATSETPVHEYAHLWASALRACNPDEWQNVVELMKGTTVWDEVKGRYPELKTDDEIADEVIATYSGSRGAERLREEQRKIAEGNGSVFEKVQAISALEKVKDALRKFWKGVADFLHIHYKNADEVADRVMKDLLDGVDPRKMGETKDDGVRFSAKQKRALKTVSASHKGKHQPTVVSSADGAKILNELERTKEKYENLSNRANTFIGDVAKALGASRYGSGSEYATFETKNGDIVTIRLANHNAHVSGFDYNDKDNGISIVITPKPNEGITNDGIAHITEFYYDSIKLRRAEGKPLAEIVRSIKQALYSGEFKDTTGLAERQEVNGEDVIRYQFIGEKGAAEADHAEEVSVRLDNLSVARKMESEQKDAKAIKMATGWERGADGKWRYEIPDLKYFGQGAAGYKKARGKQPWSKELDGLSDRIFAGIELSESEYQRFDELTQKEEIFKTDYLNREKPHLADWVENDKLFNAYPDLKRVKMVFTDQLPVNMGGWYNEREHTIVVNTNYVDDLASVLAHEVQHAIQYIEGFARGGNPESMQERFEAAKKEWRARAWADELRYQAGEMGEHYNQVAVEKALIDEYKEMGMDNDEWMPDKETRMKGFNYFARGYADRSLDADIKNFRLAESTRAGFSPYVEYTQLGGEVESRNVERRMAMSSEERRASLAADTEDVAREDQILLMGNGADSHHVFLSLFEQKIQNANVSSVLDDINKVFNSRLDELLENPNQKDRVLRLGRSSEFLRNGGLADAEIVLDFDKLARKSKEGYKHEHPFDISDIKDLPIAISSPIAVFDNTNGKNDGRVILTELTKDDRNFIVAVKASTQRRKGGVVLEVNQITTLFPKDAKGLVHWFCSGKATNIDKGKALRFIEALPNHPGTTIKAEELISAAKVVKDFVNSKALQEKVDEDAGMKFRLLDDDDPKAMELEALPDSELMAVYRNVQVFEDDALGSPMAFTDAETGERRTLEGRRWNYSVPPKVELTEEQQRKLDELNKNGYIMVDGKKSTELQITDGLKFVKPKTKESQLQYFLKKNPEDKGLWAAYDPYDHAIETPLNTQFGEAYKRPNLVVVRSFIPKSEIDEPFHADYALLPTGAHQWNNGRTLYLSRWSKIDKVLSREEEAKLIDEYWKKHPGKREELKTHRDYNRFVPQVRRELEKLGYRFEFNGKELTPEESLALDKQNWESRDVIPGREGHIPFVSNEDIARINAKMAGKWFGEPKEAMENAMIERVTELSERLHTPVRIIRTEEELAALPSMRQRRMKGSFNTLTGEVTIVVPNNANMADIENTFVHEVVGHDGLRVLFPDEAKLNNALDELYRVSVDEIRGTIDRMAQQMYDAEVNRICESKRREHDANGEDVNLSYYADMAAAHAEADKKREQFRRDATEEYGANLAGRIGEKGFEKMSTEELTFWGKLTAMFQKALDKLLDGLNIPGKRRWGDKDWAFVLHEAYKRKKNGGRSTVFDAADTEVMRRKTGFGETKFSDGTVRDKRSDGLDKVNERFNEQLGTLTEKNADSVVFSLGLPSAVLKSAGVENKPMKLYGNKVMRKMRKHGFALEELRDLPRAVADPIAVFNNYGKDGNRSILTELHTANGNFLVTIGLGKGKDDIDFNIVSSVFGKDDDNIVDWLNRDLATYISKEKALNYLHHSALRAVTSDGPRLSTAAKVVKNFVNPKVFDENIANDGIIFRDGGDIEVRNVQNRMVMSLEDRRPRTLSLEDREAGSVMVDHLRSMGIIVSTDNQENRRVLKNASKDHSEIGKVRHFKTEQGESYGFAYKGKIHLDLRKIDAELPLHEYAHLWCASLRRINPDSWNNVVEMLKQDGDTWQFITVSYLELQNDDDIAEEVIAHYSGKRGAEKLKAELQRMSQRDDNYASRWGNIYQNISKAIQDFWKHIGDSLNFHYENKEDLADQILNDFAKEVNPLQKVEKWLKERDRKYGDYVAAGDTEKAQQLFTAALHEHVGNGITPYIAVGGYRGKMDQLARSVKSGEDPVLQMQAINKAADLMTPLISSYTPDKAVLVPTPSHTGAANDMLALANAISERTGIQVADVLRSAPRESQYKVKKETGKPLSSVELGIRKDGDIPDGKLPIIVDNVVGSGNTAKACVDALGSGIVLAVASAVTLNRHVSSLKSAAPILYDKDQNLIPLSKRFEFKNHYTVPHDQMSVNEPIPYQEPDIIQGLESYDTKDIRAYVQNSVQEVLDIEYPEEDIYIKQITIIGSRTRGEGREDSDLDILLEYGGDDVREDDLFNVLNNEENKITLEGIEFDINPINAKRSLNTAQWLARDARWREEDIKMKVSYKNNTDMESKVVGQQVQTKQQELLKFYTDLKSVCENELVLLRQKSFIEAFGHDAELTSKMFSVPLYERTIGEDKVSFAMVPKDKYIDMLEDIDVDLRIVSDPIQEELLEDIRPTIVEVSNNQPQQAERPYHIVVGTDNRPGGVEGEYHVHFPQPLANVSFEDFKKLAENMGGTARMMNDEPWADFYGEEDAIKFADKAQELNVDRIAEQRDDTLSVSQIKISNWENLDYTKYIIPEGVNVENASVTRIPPKDGEKWAKFVISADVNGKHYSHDMWGNDIKAFYEKDENKKRTNRVTLDQLVAKYFGKQFADSMSIGSVQEAEHVLAEQKDDKKQAIEGQEQKQQAQVDKEKGAAERKAADEKKAQEESAKKKAEEEKKNDKKEKIPAVVLQTTLLIGALASAKAHDGKWLNRGGKLFPNFVQKGQVVSPFNALMMALHSDANGYKTNTYTTFNGARTGGYSVKGGESGLPFNWYNWDKYVNRFNSKEIISKESYEKLPAEEKELFKVLRSKEERSIFNIDQTTMPQIKVSDYNTIVEEQEKEQPKLQQPSESDETKAAVVAMTPMLKQFYDLKGKHPDAVLLFRRGDFYETYSQDAEKASKILGITLTKSSHTKDADGKPLAMAGFPYHALDTYLPKLIRAGERVAICDQLDDFSQKERCGVSEIIYAKGSELVTALSKHENVVLDPYRETGYDSEKGILHFNQKRVSPMGQEVSTAISRLNDTYRASVGYTGEATRLNRGGSAKLLPEDTQKYDRLVQELAAGVMMSRHGYPATLSKENMDLVPYWERELKESPVLMDLIERDVNRAVEVLDKIKNGETVDYSAIRGEKAFDAARPKLYTIASELAAIPNANTKEVVIVKDSQKKSAAVILPAGASLEVNNEVPGMNKNRFVIALRKQGFDDVQFYNAGGALGLNQSNEFFADKTVEIAKLKQYEIITIESIDLTEEIERTSKVDIEKVSITRDDKNNPLLYVKPTDGESFTVYPEPADVKTFFQAFRTQEFDSVRESLGQKYYSLVLRHPDLKRNVLMPDISEDIDLSRITKVNITKDKYKENTTIIFATIDGESQKPVELSKLQAQRFWLVDDQDMYKLAIAAQIWQEKLNVNQGQSEDGQAQFRDNHEGSVVGSGSSAVEAKASSEKEECQEKKSGRLHL